MEIEITPHFQALKKADRAAALALRLRTRDQFMQAFADGYVAVRLERTPHRTAYMLIKV
jgi:predicted GNAT superfamily acetyltransferase